MGVAYGLVREGFFGVGGGEGDVAVGVVVLRQGLNGLEHNRGGKRRTWDGRMRSQ